ncbi:hypothetical protein G9A89_010483 [Geosiphon pyriformis]|nr:hypothetical protein G9A89_010483 [Geosiphon pyriformis]
MNNPAKQEDIVYWHKNMSSLISIITETKLWIFTSGIDSDNLDFGVAIIMNISLAHYVCKISEIPGQLIFVRLLFKNKLFVSILGLYANAFLLVWFFQAGKINSMIAKAVNEFSFVVLSGNFNEDGSYKCASFKKCLDFGLVNFFGGSSLVKTPTWTNFCNVAKMIDFFVCGVRKFFDTDHWTVSVSVGLGRLLDVQLNSLHKQADRDHGDVNKWENFNNTISANAGMLSNEFNSTVKHSNLNAMWDVLCKIMMLSANEIFRKKWFKNFDSMFTKVSLKFHLLELLVSKIIKASHKKNGVSFISLMKCWDSLDNFDVDSNHVHSAFFGIRKLYCTFKLVEFLAAREVNIRSAIDKRIESFEMNKGYTIRSVLEHPLHKVVLNHLVVDDKLILEPGLVKSKPLNYVFDKTFSGIMDSVEFSELLGMVSVLPNDKAAGLLGITNKLWKHCDKSILNMLLKAWVSMIPKPYECESVLMNTCPIALIEMAHKILFKILSDRISLVCNTFSVLYGDNFSVLKGTMTQSSIFAVSSVVENALQKNREL